MQFRITQASIKGKLKRLNDKIHRPIIQEKHINSIVKFQHIARSYKKLMPLAFMIPENHT